VGASLWGNSSPSSTWNGFSDCFPESLQLFNDAAILAIVNVRAVGEFIRKQRQGSSLSLRKVSGLAGVSIPYLSQIERGLRKPSADILQAIAKALRISAETLYVQAGILEDRPAPDVTAAVMSDSTITERQREALLQIYESFRDETRARARKPSARAPKAQPPAGPPPRVAARGLSSPGGKKSPASRQSSPRPRRPSATNPRKEV
jgi:transcriptional regulator with XRE-family HTH domain